MNLTTSLSHTLRVCGLPFLGGSLYALGNLGWALWPLAFVCMIPLWQSLDKLNNTSMVAAIYRGLIFGLAIYLLGFSWLFTLSEQFIDSASTSTLLWLTTGLWFASGFGIYGAIYRYLVLKTFPAWASATLPLILLESCQVNIFPSFLGAGLVHQPDLAQLASLGGPIALTALALFINWQIYKILKRPNKAFLARPLSKICAVILAALLYAAFQLNSLDNSPGNTELSVGLVQNNVVKTKSALEDRYSHQFNLSLSRELLERKALDLLIWPESSYNRALRRPLPLDAQMIREDISTPLLFGGTSSFHFQGRASSANSIFLADAKGKIEQVYDKQLLLPFGEQVPGLTTLETLINKGLIDWLPELRKDYLQRISQLFPWHQSFKAGPKHGVLQLGTVNIATPICFELVRPDYVRQLIHDGKANLLVSFANDSWFGRSQEPAIHLALARLRAIENGLWLVRATNSGYSAVISPRGELVSQTGLFEQAVLSARVTAITAPTLYTLYGNWLAWLAGLLLVSLSFRRVFASLLQDLALIANR